jgi:peroxiredoxin
MLKQLLLFVAGTVCLFAITIPRPAGDVPLTMVGGRSDNLSNYKGRPVILSVFIATCVECQRTAQRLDQIQKDFKAQGLQVLEVAFRPDDDDAVLRKFAKEHNVTLPIGHIDPDVLVQFGQIKEEMRPTVPMVFFIDRQGMVQGQYFGADPFMEEKYQDQNMRAKLMQLLPKRDAGTKATPKK